MSSTIFHSGSALQSRGLSARLSALLPRASNGEGLHLCVIFFQVLAVAFKVGQVFLPVALAVFDFEYFYSLFKPSRPARHARPAREQLFPGSENTAQQSREAPGLPPRGTQSPAIVPVAQPPQNK